MKHYIYRDRYSGGKIILACDAEDITEADQRFQYHFGNVPRGGISVEPVECVAPNGTCVLPHTVGEKHLIRLAPDKKPKSIQLSAPKIPGIKLFPNITPRQYYSSCFYCGRDMTDCTKDAIRTKDHVTPRSLGGKLKVPCCLECNKLKGQLKLEEYRVIVAYRNGLIPLEILQQVKFKGEEMVEFDTE
jgi:hypothetical protein